MIIYQYENCNSIWITWSSTPYISVHLSCQYVNRESISCIHMCYCQSSLWWASCNTAHTQYNICYNRLIYWLFELHVTLHIPSTTYAIIGLYLLTPCCSTLIMPIHFNFCFHVYIDNITCFHNYKLCTHEWVRSHYWYIYVVYT